MPQKKIMPNVCLAKKQRQYIFASSVRPIGLLALVTFYCWLHFMMVGSQAKQQTKLSNDDQSESAELTATAETDLCATAETLNIELYSTSPLLKCKPHIPLWHRPIHDLASADATAAVQ